MAFAMHEPWPGGLAVAVAVAVPVDVSNFDF
jgi:hypothetical protein